MKLASRAELHHRLAAKSPNMSQRLAQLSWRLTRTSDSSCGLSLRRIHARWISAPQSGRKSALAVFLASALAVAVLQPMPAVGQAACDPSTSYCGGSTGSGQQGQGLQLPNLQNGTVPGTTPTQQQNPYGNGGGGGYNGAGGNYNGAPQSMDLQPSPNYVDNLSDQGGGLQHFL